MPEASGNLIHTVAVAPAVAYRLPSDTWLLLSPIPSYSYLPYHLPGDPPSRSKPTDPNELPKTYLQHDLLQTLTLLILQKAIRSTSLVAGVTNSKLS